ncbi:MAG: DUF5009 domain-containing protein [Thermoguttaceae bacterium]
MLADCVASVRPATLSAPAMPVAACPQRVLSLDALRGLTMVWIVGGRELLVAAVQFFYPECPWIDGLKAQLDHPWEGYVAWDFIMPMFLFVVGAALPWAMAKRMRSGGPLRPTYGRIFRRVLLLWVIGIVFQQIRYLPGTFEIFSNCLQAIAVGYLVTSLALLHLPVKGQVGLFVGLVAAYGAILMFVPFPGHAAGTLRADANLALWVDQIVLGPFRRAHGFTWVLSSLGFAATVLLGALAGQLLRSRLTNVRKLLWMVAIGLSCAATGWVWSYWLPLNRHVWTSSMILWAGGLSFLVLALFYAVLDVGGLRWWSFPFIVVGANALLIYVLDSFVDKLSIAAVNWTNVFLEAEWPVQQVDLCSALVEVGVLWAICWVLYRRRIFLRA